MREGGSTHSLLATLRSTAAPPYEVRQYGQRKLCDEVETAYRWWIDTGKPTANSWKFTITPHEHRIELC